jgi:hypothetical protein
MHIDHTDNTSIEEIVSEVLEAMFPPMVLAGLVFERFSEERKEKLRENNIQPVLLQRFDGLRAVIRRKHLYTKI